MIGLKFAAAKMGFFDQDRVLLSMAKVTSDRLSKLGAFIMTRARSSIRNRKKSSKPGQTPSNWVGLIKEGQNAINFSYDFSTKSVVVGGTLINKSTGALHTLEFGGDTEITEHRFRHRGGKNVYEAVTKKIHILPRPYMGPAFEKEYKKAPQLFENSLR